MTFVISGCNKIDDVSTSNHRQKISPLQKEEVIEETEENNPETITTETEEDTTGNGSDATDNGDNTTDDSETTLADTTPPPGLKSATITTDYENHNIKLDFEFPADVSDIAKVYFNRNPVDNSCTPTTDSMEYTGDLNGTGSFIDNVAESYTDTYNYQICIADAAGNLTLSHRFSDQPAPEPFNVIGQPNSTTIETNHYSMWPIQIYADSEKLYVVSGDEQRVLIWNSHSTLHSEKPDLVIGHKSLNITSGFNDDATADTLTYPKGIHVANGKLVVSDSNNHRILIWNNFPSSSGAPADVVLGQNDFTTLNENNGGLSASSLDNPESVYIYETKLFVVDSDNHRVLIWNTIPTANNSPADIVIGQPDFTSNTANNGGIGANTLNAPFDLKVHQGKIYLSDTYNHRILIFNSIPTTNFASADVVIGQPDFTTATANTEGSVTAKGFNYPVGLSVKDNALAVADYTNGRVLLYNSLPTTNFVAADVVVGQPDMTSSGNNINGTVDEYGLKSPRGVAFAGEKLYIADFYNVRVVGYNHIPTTNFEKFDFIKGQPTSNLAMAMGANAEVTLKNMVKPRGIAINADKTKMAVADNGQNRILVWNSIPDKNNQAADFVLGQVDEYSAGYQAGGINAGHGTSFHSVLFVGDKLIASDWLDHRILIWNNPTSTSDADIVLGQPDFTSKTSNNGGRSASSLANPTGLCSDGTKLVVTEYGNNRVLIWNTVPATNNQAADLVLGQAGFTTGGANSGGLSASSFKRPMGCAIENNKLFVLDSQNYRILVWNTFPTANNQPADVVMGQANFVTGAILSASSTSMDTSLGMIHVEDGKLYLADGTNNRVLIWNSIPTTNNQAADRVIGADDFSPVVLAREIHREFLNYPYGIATTAKKIFISAGNRIIAVDK